MIAWWWLLVLIGAEAVAIAVFLICIREEFRERWCLDDDQEGTGV